MSAKIALLYDGNEFPQALHYAQCHSIFAKNICISMETGNHTPCRYDFTQVFVLVRDAEKFKPVIDGYRKHFPVTLLDLLPDYRKKTQKEVYSLLKAKGYTEPFSDVFAMQKELKEQAQRRIENEEKAQKTAEEESKGLFTDPNPTESLKTGVFKPVKRRKSCL